MIFVFCCQLAAQLETPQMLFWGLFFTSDPFKCVTLLITAGMSVKSLHAQSDSPGNGELVSSSSTRWRNIPTNPLCVWERKLYVLSAGTQLLCEAGLQRFGWC